MGSSHAWIECFQAKNLLKLVRKKIKKKLVFQKPISPLGSKLLKSIENWN